jgi:hypothetical protein
MLKKLNHLLFLTLFICVSLSAAKTEEKMLRKWVMDRQQWQSETQSFIKKCPEDSDSQILLRYLQVLTKNSQANKQSGDSLMQAAERTIEYCPGGIAELEYILTGKNSEGQHALIAITEAVWMQHLKQIEKRIQEKRQQEK